MDMEQFLVCPAFPAARGRPWCKCTPCAPAAAYSSSRTPSRYYLFLLFFISARPEAPPCPGISSSPSCWRWPFLAPGKGSRTGKGDNCSLCFRCLVLSHLGASHQRAVPTCPWMMLSKDDECCWGTLLGVSCCFPALIFATF